jgi:hypothetical protein
MDQRHLRDGFDVNTLEYIINFPDYVLPLETKDSQVYLQTTDSCDSSGRLKNFGCYLVCPMVEHPRFFESVS